MDKIKNAARKTGSFALDAGRVLGEVASVMADNHARIESMTDELMKRTSGVDRESARAIAVVLTSQAEEIVWK